MMLVAFVPYNRVGYEAQIMPLHVPCGVDRLKTQAHRQQRPPTTLRPYTSTLILEAADFAIGLEVEREKRRSGAIIRFFQPLSEL